MPEVVTAPPSIDATLALLDAPGPRLLLLVDAPRPQLAAVAAAITGAPDAAALAGRAKDVARCLPDVAANLPAGRLVFARDWLADPVAARLARPAIAGLSEPSPDDRPRTLAESPVPASPVVRDALLHAARWLDLRRYPPVVPVRLADALARRHGVSPSEVVVSSGGSLELIERVLRVFSAPGDPVVSHAPAFHGLVAACLREDRPLRLVAGTSGDIGLQSLAESAAGCRIACLASPNAVDSRRFPPDAIERLRRVLGPARLLLIDEAYAGFTPALDLPPLADDATLAPVVRLRSLSKLEGIAGLRVGYALASAPVASMLRRLSAPYAMPALVEDVAVAAVEEHARAAVVTSTVDRVRPLLAAGLARLGFDVAPSTTHLLLARPSPDRVGFWTDAAEALGLPFEPCPEADGAFQLSVGDDDAARRLLEAMETALATRPG